MQPLLSTSGGAQEAVLVPFLLATPPPGLNLNSAAWELGSCRRGMWAPGCGMCVRSSFQHQESKLASESGRVRLVCMGVCLRPLRTMQNPKDQGTGEKEPLPQPPSPQGPL